VLHWNTHHGGVGTDGRYDPERLVNWIVKMNADIISLNEVGSSSEMNAIVSRINAKTGRTWETMWDGRGNLLLTRLAVNNTSICVVNSSVGRKAAHMSTIVNGRTLNVWSAHLVNDDSTGLDEAKALMACASNWAEARILAGDYNAGPEAAPIRETAETYTNAWTAAKAIGTAKDDSSSCDGCTFKSYRIDHVFTSKSASFLRLRSAEVVDTRDADGVRPADHKPLLVTYSVN
jgi:endonuclease/exonuclease/phosphatase family metal-dependent hydrolase